jgi:hypothetical protein
MIESVLHRRYRPANHIRSLHEGNWDEWGKPSSSYNEPRSRGRDGGCIDYRPLLPSIGFVVIDCDGVLKSRESY